jgi:hypothetical protein
MLKAGFSHTELMEMPGETFASVVNIYHEAIKPEKKPSNGKTYKVRRDKKTR